MIGIQHEEMPVLDPLTEPLIVTKNQPTLTIIAGVVQAPQVRKLPMMEEFVVVTTAYKAGENRTPQRISRTGIDSYIPVARGTRAVDVSVISAVCTSPPLCDPPSVLWDSRIGNICQTNTPNLR